MGRLEDFERKALAFGNLRVLGMNGLIGEDAVERTVSRSTKVTQEFRDVEADAVRLLKTATDEFKDI